MRYIIDQHELEPEDRLRLFRALVTWAIPLCDNFRCMINIIAYSDPADAERYMKLGEATELPPDNAGLLQKVLRYRLTRPVRIVGTTSPELLELLTTNAAPPGAIAGDESPVEDLYLHAGARALYTVADYGRDHLLELTDDEAESVRALIDSLGLSPSILGRHDVIME